MAFDPIHHDQRHHPENLLDITPTRKHNWKSLGAREYWAPHLYGFREDVFVNLVPEIVANVDHPQNVAIIRVGEEDQVDLAGRCRDLGLVFKEAAALRHDSTGMYTSFPNHFDAGGTNKHNFVVADSTEIAEQFMAATTNDADTDTIRQAHAALGAPECCIDAHLTDASVGNIDPVYDIACNTPSAVPHEGEQTTALVEHPHPLLNVLFRHHGWQFIPHLPCHFECEPSIEVGKQTYQIMADAGFKQQAEQLVEWLSLPALWDAYHGCINVRTAYSTGEYTADDHLINKKVIWRRPHEDKPDFEPNHNTTELEVIDPDAKAI